MSVTAWMELIASGLITGGIYALVALGLNLQYGLMRILNIAHGEFLMVGAYLTWMVQTQFGYHVVRLDTHLEPLNRTMAAAEDELRARVLPDLRRKAFREWTDALTARYGVALDVDALTAVEGD